MGWVTLNEDECPGCQRRGDTGDRKNGLCWRCNLPETLDPDEHGKYLLTIEWERRNLLDTQRDIDTLTDGQFKSAYGNTKDYARPIVARMLTRNAADLAALDIEEDEAA